MGNYFEGRLNFMFKLGNDDITNEVLQFIYDTRYIDVMHQDDGDYYKAYVEYVSTHDDIISKGLRMYLDKYGDIRIHKSYIRYGIDAKDDAIINRLANNGFDPDELVQYYEDDDGTVVFPPKEEATYDYIMRETLKELEVTEDDITLVADIVISVCEKYNGDEDLVRLIDLWSPYIYNDCIGNIRDEDCTFNKDYFRNNNGKIEHYEFCGDWCESYYPTASCKSEFCKKLYDLGAESIKSKLLTSERGD